MIYDDINTVLSANAALTALVSDRIYPVRLAQGCQYPAVRFEATLDGGFKDLDGQGDTLEVDLQVDAVASTNTQALAIATAVRDQLKNFSGAFGASTLTRINLESELDTFDFSIDGGKFRASQSWTLWLY